jgi:hypothetical protein
MSTTIIRTVGQLTIITKITILAVAMTINTVTFTIATVITSIFCRFLAQFFSIRTYNRAFILTSDSHFYTFISNGANNRFIANVNCKVICNALDD